MKKTFSMLILVLCTSNLAVMAQDDDLTGGQEDLNSVNREDIINIAPHDKGFTMGMGFRAGGTLTSLSGEPDEGDLYDGMGFGFAAGLTMNMRFGKANSEVEKYSGRGPLGVQLEVLYRNLSAKTLGDDNLKLNSLEIPLLLQFYPGFKTKGFKTIYLEAGPVFAIPMGASPDELTVGGNRSYKTGDLKPFDIRAAVGLGWRHPRSGVGLNVRYYLGMSELAKNFPIKANTLEFALTYKFNVAGNSKHIKDN